jgi:Concanavalin A-like lectin/glucanases superfamily
MILNFFSIHITVGECSKSDLKGEKMPIKFAGRFRWTTGSGGINIPTSGGEGGGGGSSGFGGGGGGGGGGPSIITSGLRFWLDASNVSSYPGSGLTWYDLSGNNNDFTLYGSPSYETNAGLSYLRFSPSNAGSGLNKTHAHGPALSITGSWSVFSWVRLDANDQNTVRTLIADSDNGTQGGFSYDITPGRYAKTKQRSGPDVVSSEYKEVPTPLQEWKCLAATYDGSYLRLYYNGVQEARKATTNVPTFGGSRTWIGMPGSFQYGSSVASVQANNMFSGSLTTVAVYGRALSDSEIAQNFLVDRSKYSLPAPASGSILSPIELTSGAANVTSFSLPSYASDTNSPKLTKLFNDAYNSAGTLPAKYFRFNVPAETYGSLVHVYLKRGTGNQDVRFTVVSGSTADDLKTANIVAGDPVYPGPDTSGSDANMSWYRDVSFVAPSSGGTYLAEVNLHSGVASDTDLQIRLVSAAVPPFSSEITPGASNVTTFNVDSTRNAVYRTGKYAKYYTFTAPASSTVNVYLGPNTNDMYLNVFTGSGSADCIDAKRVAYNDDNAGSDAYMTWNSRATFTSAATTTTYIIEATTFYSAVTVNNAVLRVVLS